jgi:hypothetical protein
MRGVMRKRKKRGPRFKAWLPRGGLGFAGFGGPVAVVLCSVLADARVALGVAAANVLLCVWCAVGLRRDDAAGEVADRYTTSGRGLRLMDMLSGQWESERRISTDLILTSLLVLVLAVVLSHMLK